MDPIRIDSRGHVTLRFVVAILFLAAQVTHAETTSGRVVHIADGDTITVLDHQNQQHKIRLVGIDAPEKAQPFGSRSQQNLGALTFGKDVVVDWAKRDRYGRIVGKVLAGTTDVGLEQIKAGMAWWYREYANEQSHQDRQDYEIAEFHAKIHRTGLWSDKNPTPPWEWRHNPLR